MRYERVRFHNFGSPVRSPNVLFIHLTLIRKCRGGLKTKVIYELSGQGSV